jgi:hypothetical protein
MMPLRHASAGSERTTPAAGAASPKRRRAVMARATRSKRGFSHHITSHARNGVSHMSANTMAATGTYARSHAP